MSDLFTDYLRSLKVGDQVLVRVVGQKGKQIAELHNIGTGGLMFVHGNLLLSFPYNRLDKSGKFEIAPDEI